MESPVETGGLILVEGRCCDGLQVTFVFDKKLLGIYDDIGHPAFPLQFRPLDAIRRNFDFAGREKWTRIHMMYATSHDACIDQG